MRIDQDWPASRAYNMGRKSTRGRLRPRRSTERITGTLKLQNTTAYQAKKRSHSRNRLSMTPPVPNHKRSDRLKKKQEEGEEKGEEGEEATANTIKWLKF